MANIMPTVGTLPGGDSAKFSTMYIRTEQSFGVPALAGSFQLTPNLKIGMTVKPNLFHRLMVRLLLGWKWVDNG